MRARRPRCRKVRARILQHAVPYMYLRGGLDGIPPAIRRNPEQSRAIPAIPRDPAHSGALRRTPGDPEPVQAPPYLGLISQCISYPTARDGYLSRTLGRTGQYGSKCTCSEVVRGRIL